MTPTPEQELIIQALKKVWSKYQETSMKIPLSQGLFAIIDTEDYDKIMSINRKWFAHKSRNTFYAETKVGGVAVKMHRVIRRASSLALIDHGNRIGLDNRKLNLKVVDSHGNAENKSVYKNNKSGVPGVFYGLWGRSVRPWHAQITRNGKQKLIGSFLTMEEAIAARLEAENVHANT